MRNAFCAAMVAVAERPEVVFLTGDLGFMALEPLRDALARRFINAGVAEQNMVGVAAGLARAGWRPWAYSIAPFIYARPYEQLRNDVAMHALPVTLVGNGGGYGYGVMGATHHALEDYGAVLALGGIRVLVPAFDSDVAGAVASILGEMRPAYLRLGLDGAPKDFERPPFMPWRRLVAGDAATILVCGPLVGGLLGAIRDLPRERRPSLWLVSELPYGELPEAFLADVAATPHLVVVEEHVATGGMGERLARDLLLRGVAPRRFTHRHALGYPSGRYGSQAFHRRECGLDPAAILAALD